MLASSFGHVALRSRWPRVMLCLAMLGCGSGGQANNSAAAEGSGGAPASLPAQRTQPTPPPPPGFSVEGSPVGSSAQQPHGYSAYDLQNPGPAAQQLSVQSVVIVDNTGARTPAIPTRLRIGSKRVGYVDPDNAREQGPQDPIALASGTELAVVVYWSANPRPAPHRFPYEVRATFLSASGEARTGVSRVNHFIRDPIRSR